MNAVFPCKAGSMQTYQYLDTRSSVVKYLAPDNKSNVSSTWVVEIHQAVQLMKKYYIPPSFFFTKISDVSI